MAAQSRYCGHDIAQAQRHAGGVMRRPTTTHHKHFKK